MTFSVSLVIFKFSQSRLLLRIPRSGLGGGWPPGCVSHGARLGEATGFVRGQLLWGAFRRPVSSETVPAPSSAVARLAHRVWPALCTAGIVVHQNVFYLRHKNAKLLRYQTFPDRLQYCHYVQKMR